MKKIFLCVAVLSAMTANAAIVSKDTVNYDGVAIAQTIKSANDYGEINVRNVVVLQSFNDKKVYASKADFDAIKAGAKVAIVYNVYDNGSRKIAKVIARKEGK